MCIFWCIWIWIFVNWYLSVLLCGRFLSTTDNNINTQPSLLSTAIVLSLLGLWCVPVSEVHLHGWPIFWNYTISVIKLFLKCHYKNSLFAYSYFCCYIIICRSMWNLLEIKICVLLYFTLNEESIRHENNLKPWM